MTIIRTENLQYLNILDYPDLAYEEGNVIFIKGASGSGKSSLLKLFNQTRTQSRGKIYYREKSVEDYDSVLLRRKILLCGQNTFLFDKTIKENFEEFYGCREQSCPDVSEIKEITKACAIDFSPETRCTELSGGERQRIYLALFLSFKPDILMLDEPTSALDEKIKNKVMEGIIGFCRKNTITPVIVSHDCSLIEKYADSVTELGKNYE